MFEMRNEHLTKIEILMERIVYEHLVVLTYLKPMTNAMINVMWSHAIGMKEIVVIVLMDAGIGW